MRSNTTHTSNTTNIAGVPPAPPEAHQRPDRKSESETGVNCFLVEQVAELLTQALAESFGAIKFNVKVRRLQHYAGIDVAWTDGPTRLQVSALARHFTGGVFDTQSWMPQLFARTFDGQQVTFETAFVDCDRFITNATVDLAIDCVYQRRQAQFLQLGIAKPSAKQYERCDLQNIFLSAASRREGRALETEISAELCKLSCCEAADSATLARFGPDRKISGHSLVGSAGSHS